MRQSFNSWWTGIAMMALLALTSSTQAAVITVFSNDFAGWSAAAGGPQTVEDFTDNVLAPGFSITFGSSVPGNISGGVYNDRADDGAVQNPVLNFAPSATAFGANWDFSPGGSATGIRLTLVFDDNSTQLVGTEIPAGFTGEFFGIVSDTAFKELRISEGTQSSGVETFQLDDARFVNAAVQPIPEPTSLVSFGLLASTAGYFGWRRRK